MSPDPSRGIFISYRREDTAPYAGRLYDMLIDRFGDPNVFMDVDSIEPGLDFAEAVRNAVGSCKVLLVLIGGEWLNATNSKGQRRIDDPTDFVYLEIEAALERDIRVIPLLVAGARMMSEEELP